MADKAHLPMPHVFRLSPVIGNNPLRDHHRWRNAISHASYTPPTLKTTPVAAGKWRRV